MTLKTLCSTPLVSFGRAGSVVSLLFLSAAAVSAQAAPARADVDFMRGMIHHHAQAIEMVNLIASRSSSPQMKSLGERINTSQRDEIGMMQSWLRQHGQEAPDPLPHLGMDMGDHDAHMMPGMLTKTQMKELAAAKGRAFDRLFLTGMIQHHTGALTMVRELFASSGAAQNTAIFRFATDVDADQRAEITRMRAMLNALPAK